MNPFVILVHVTSFLGKPRGGMRIWMAVCAKKVGVAQVKVVQVQGAKLLEAVPKFEYARQTEAAHVEWVRTSRVRRVQRLVVRGRL